MFYITGDKHADFDDFLIKSKKMNILDNDIVIILGDSGLNYMIQYNDNMNNKQKKYKDTLHSLILKEKLNKSNTTYFIVHGNHEARPNTVEEYKEKIWKNGIVYYQEDFPNLLFAKDGEIYNFDGKSIFVCGGAYSIDKFYRMRNGYRWFDDEQPNEIIKKECLEKLKNSNNEVDIVLSHICPLKYEPTEVFLSNYSQDEIDKSTEKFLDFIENNINYKKWYCGHYHTDKKIDKMIFLYNDILKLK